MKVLITGARGFIGGSIGRFASAQQHHVLGIGRTSQPPETWAGEFASADILQSDISPFIADFAPDLIVHCAGSASVGASFARPAEDFQSSAGTLSNLLDSVRRSACNPLVVLVSSAAVYGNPETLPVSEEQTCLPVSPYGFHKMVAELEATAYAACFGMRLCICRLFSVYGIAQRRLLLWDLFQQFSSKTDEVSLAGTGAETRDYLHIDDASRAILRFPSVFTFHDFQKKPLVLNLATGRECSVKDFAASVGRLGGWKKPIRFRGDTRQGDPKRWQADIRKLETCLPDWSSRPMDEGLSETLAAWQTDLSSLDS